MFITLKAQKAASAMEEVFTKDAATGSNKTPQSLSNTRRPACIACQRRKLRCTGSLEACDRCLHRAVTCVMASSQASRSRNRARTTKRPSEVPESPRASYAIPVVTGQSQVEDAYETFTPSTNSSDFSIDPVLQGNLGVTSDLATSQRMFSLVMNGIDMAAPAESPAARTASEPCSCTKNVMRVLTNIEEDHFRLMYLSLDQIVQLQKWLMFQCCTALECPRCHADEAVHTIIHLICKRVLEIFECSARRMRTAALDLGRLPASEGHSGVHDFQPSGLHSSVSGEAMDEGHCPGGICLDETQMIYSIEEQMCMVSALMKLQIRSLHGLLDWTAGLSQNSEAKKGRIAALKERLTKAAESIDHSVSAMIDG